MWINLPISYCVHINVVLKSVSLIRAWHSTNMVSVSKRTAQANFQLCHCLSSRQLFVASRGIPGFSGRRSLSLACFMGTGGRACQMVFLRNHYVLIHSWGGVLFTPTASFLLGSDCQAYRTGRVYKNQRREVDVVMWKGAYISAHSAWMSDTVLHPFRIWRSWGGRSCRWIGACWTF